MSFNPYGGGDYEEATEYVEEPETIESDIDDSSEVVEETPEPESLYPSYIPKEFHPKEFKDEREEADFYKKNYKEVLNYYSKDEFVQGLKEAYKNQLLESDQEVEKLKAVKSMFEEDPYLAMKVFAPEVLTQYGHSATFSDVEKQEYIQAALAKEFGEDYEDVFDENQANNPRSISGKMRAYANQLDTQINTENQRRYELAQKSRPLTPQEVQQELQQSYNQMKNEVTPEEYKKFTGWLTTTAKDLKVPDLYKLYKYEDKVKEAFEKGKLEGKKEIKNNIKNVNGQFVEPKQKVKQESNSIADNFAEMMPVRRNYLGRVI